MKCERQSKLKAFWASGELDHYWVKIYGTNENEALIDLLNNGTQFTRKEISNARMMKNFVGWVVKVPVLNTKIGLPGTSTNFSFYILTDEEYKARKRSQTHI